MLRVVALLLQKMLHLSCLISNDVADVAPFSTSYLFANPEMYSSAVKSAHNISHLNSLLTVGRGMIDSPLWYS
jgi:hypothetical protein